MNNPALRLHDLLFQLRQQPSGEGLAQSLTTITGADNDLADLLEAVAALSALPAEIERRLRQVTTINLDLHLSWMPAVEATLAHFFNLATSNAPCQATITDSALLGLQFAGEVLKTGGKAATDEQLGALLTALSELDRLIDQNADADLRIFLHDLVYEMQRAIRFVKVRGVDGLEVALERSIGAMTLRYKRTQTVPDSGFMNKFMEVVNRLAAVIGVANSSLELTENAANVLELGR